ncbi:hypothetical protein BU197_22930 [Streptomyces sp. CBMA291]|nr:hypothetical protein [Streptomyces sp. CBMA291]
MGEQFLEGGPVEGAVAGAEAAAGGLVDAAVDARGEAADGGGPGLGMLVRRDPGGDPQAHQVQVRGEDLLAVGTAWHRSRQGGAHLGEQPQGQRVAGVGLGEVGLGQSVPRADGLGLGRGVGPEEDGGGQSGAGLPEGPVQRAGGVEGTGLFPVLGAAGGDEVDPVRAEPFLGGRGPRGEPVGEGRGHLLGAVEDDEERPARLVGEGGGPFGGGGAGVPDGARRRGGPGGLPQGAADGVGEGVVVGAQVGAA